MNGHETKDKAVALKTLNGEDKELISHQEKDPELIKKSTFDQAATSEDNYDSDIDHPVVCCYAGDSVRQFASKFLPYVLDNWTGFLCIFGGFAICTSLGVDFSYPNLTTYVVSYMRARSRWSKDITYSSFTYLIITKSIVQGCTMPFVGKLTKKLGPQWSIIIGALIHSAAYFSPFVLLNWSFYMVTAGLSLHGLAFSFIYGPAIKAAQSWFPHHHKGLVAAVVVSGYGFGSCIWAPVETYYVNPNDLQPVQTDNTSNLYFKDGKNNVDPNWILLYRIPWMFTILGWAFFGMGFFSMFFISENYDSPKKTIVFVYKNLSCREVLQRKWFYQTWIGFLGINTAVIMFATFSKSFGQTFIEDDHFFANVAIAQNILNGSGRILWGYLYDRFLFTKCYAAIALSVLVLVPGFYFTSYLEHNSSEARACYALIMCLFYTICPGIYVIVAAEVATAFGPKNYTSNFGLYYAHYILYAIIFFTLQQIPGFHGMEPKFIFTGVMAAVGLMSVLSSYVARFICH